MTEKEIDDAIAVMSESLEVNDVSLTGVYSTLINYLRANVDDILDATDYDLDIDESQMSLF